MTNTDIANLLNVVQSQSTQIVHLNILLQSVISILVDENIVRESVLADTVTKVTQKYMEAVKSMSPASPEEELNSHKSTLFNPIVGLA